MRNTTLLALVALLSCLAVSQAQAISLVKITYSGGSTKQMGVGGTGIEANVSDMLSFDVSVDVDAAGLAVLAADLQFQSNADLLVTSATWETGTKFTTFGPPATSYILLGGEAVTTEGDLSEISNIGWITGSPTGPFATSTNVFLGTIVFHVGAAQNSMIQLGFFDASTAVGQDGSLLLVTPDFEGFSVMAPQPGATALVMGGIGTLAALSWRRRPRS